MPEGGVRGRATREPGPSRPRDARLARDRRTPRTRRRAEARLRRSRTPAPRQRRARKDERVHESQSRLWDNLVARSRPFWSHLYPRLRDAFPGVPGNVETLYRTVNAVRPSEFVTPGIR